MGYHFFIFKTVFFTLSKNWENFENRRSILRFWDFEKSNFEILKVQFWNFEKSKIKFWDFEKSKIKFWNFEILKNQKSNFEILKNQILKNRPHSNFENFEKSTSLEFWIFWKKTTRSKKWKNQILKFWKIKFWNFEILKIGFWNFEKIRFFEKILDFRAKLYNINNILYIIY